MFIEQPLIILSAHIFPLSPPPQSTHNPNVRAFSCVIVQPLIMCRTRSLTSSSPNDGYGIVVIDPNELAHASTKSFLGALALNGIILVAEITAFTYMRRYFRLIYEPRSWSFFDEWATNFRSQLTVKDINCSLENDNRHYPLDSGDGRPLFCLQTIPRSRISMGSTATFSSVSCA